VGGLAKQAPAPCERRFGLLIGDDLEESSSYVGHDLTPNLARHSPVRD
jgi:hypothetical protein